MLASRSTSEPGDEGADDDVEDVSDAEVEALDALYFRLTTTVGVPWVWPTGSPTWHLGSGVGLWGSPWNITAMHDRDASRIKKGEKRYVRVNCIPIEENTAFDTPEFMRGALT